ncbi:hypothetical protein TIFTF001_029774 [Ficus carica]|uniref:Uncharacterized protein n=1 Tax=Ficus carica TaxID=3494 RepID=A0AA88DSJ7_FICCA|nr:hypothetical protein TIFTF001_029774 [Ficus carica]
MGLAAPITPWLHATVSNLPTILDARLWKASTANCEIDGMVKEKLSSMMATSYLVLYRPALEFTRDVLHNDPLEHGLLNSTSRMDFGEEFYAKMMAL